MPDQPKSFVIRKNPWGKYLCDVKEIHPDGTEHWNPQVGAQHASSNVARQKILQVHPDATIKVEK